MTYLVGAYCFVWLVLFGYMRYLHGRLKAVRKELDLLKESSRKHGGV